MNRYAIILPLIATVGTLASPVQAAPHHDRATPRASVQENGSAVWVDPVMPQLAATSGRALMAHLRGADAALSGGDVADARSELLNSAEFVQGIEAMMPFLVLTDRVRDARTGLSETSVETFSAKLLPIYARLDDLQVYAPKVAHNAKARLKEAESRARSGNISGAHKALAKVEDDLTETVAYLPVQFVGDQIAAARAALDRNPADTSTARKAVQNALGSLEVVQKEWLTGAHG